MQPPDQPPSSVSSSTSSDLVLKPNATTEEKLALLAVLVPKAENAKNRVADLHSKILTTVEQGNQLAGKILEVNGYAHLFFQGMNPQLVLIDKLVSQLSSERPRLIALLQQLKLEKSRLDEFSSSLAKLRSVVVHPALKDYLLPELPPEEETGTLADWANASELLNTHNLLLDDLNQMQVLADWGMKQILKVTEKHKIVVDESTSSSGIIEELGKLDMEAWVSELSSGRRVADSVLLDCSGHFARVSEALKMKDVLALPTFMSADFGLAMQLLSISKARSRVLAIHTELTNAATRGEALVAKLQALGGETLNFIAECRTLVTEFDHMDADIQSYVVPANSEAGYADLKRSVDAWTEFVKVYDSIVGEIERRRQVLQQHRMVAMRYQRELNALYETEVHNRDEFDKGMIGANIPPSWTALEFLAEPPIAFHIKPNMDESVLPNLGTEISSASHTLQHRQRGPSFGQTTDTAATSSQSTSQPSGKDDMTDLARTLQPSRSASARDPLSFQDHQQQLQNLQLSPRVGGAELPDGNSLLGSNFSISESMLDDRTELFHSATDQQLQHQGLGETGTLPPQRHWHQ